MSYCEPPRHTHSATGDPETLAWLVMARDGLGGVEWIRVVFDWGGDFRVQRCWMTTIGKVEDTRAEHGLEKLRRWYINRGDEQNRTENHRLVGPKYGKAREGEKRGL